jgi:hypothetical protein
MTSDTESTPSTPRRDEGLEWLREIRRQLAAECNYDPYEMGRRIRERQKRYPGRIYRTKRVLVPVDDPSQQ